MNIAIIAGLFGRLFTRWFGARRGTLAAVLGIAVYTVLVGAGASVVRAALMAGLALTAQRLGRQGDALAGLGAAEDRFEAVLVVSTIRALASPPPPARGEGRRA